jgi:hypothetical protein
MFMHLKHYNMPLLQRQIVRIIAIVPIYAFGAERRRGARAAPHRAPPSATGARRWRARPPYFAGSLLSLIFPSSAIYFGTIRDIYEAYVIHSFLNLMLDFPGGEPAVVAGILDKPRMKHPIPCCCCPRAWLRGAARASLSRGRRRSSHLPPRAPPRPPQARAWTTPSSSGASAARCSSSSSSRRWRSRR